MLIKQNKIMEKAFQILELTFLKGKESVQDGKMEKIKGYLCN